MITEDKFSEVEISHYKRELKAILTDLQEYRKEKDRNPNPLTSPSPQMEDQLDRLERALTDLDTNLSMGKKLWFSQYRDVMENYRFGPSLNTAWVRIGPQFDRLWYQLSLRERMFVSISERGFWLPNLHGKQFEALYELLMRYFRIELKDLGEEFKDYDVNILKGENAYHIQIPNIVEEAIISIEYRASKVDVKLKPGLTIPQKIVDLIFNLLSDYLGV